MNNALDGILKRNIGVRIQFECRLAFENLMMERIPAVMYFWLPSTVSYMESAKRKNNN